MALNNFAAFSFRSIVIPGWLKSGISWIGSLFSPKSRCIKPKRFLLFRLRSRSSERVVAMRYNQVDIFDSPLKLWIEGGAGGGAAGAAAAAAAAGGAGPGAGL